MIGFDRAKLGDGSKGGNKTRLGESGH